MELVPEELFCCIIPENVFPTLPFSTVMLAFLRAPVAPKTTPAMIVVVEISLAIQERDYILRQRFFSMPCMPTLTLKTLPPNAMDR